MDDVYFIALLQTDFYEFWTWKSLGFMNISGNKNGEFSWLKPKFKKKKSNKYNAHKHNLIRFMRNLLYQNLKKKKNLFSIISVSKNE